MGTPVATVLNMDMEVDNNLETVQMDESSFTTIKHHGKNQESKYKVNKIDKVSVNFPSSFTDSFDDAHFARPPYVIIAETHKHQIPKEISFKGPNSTFDKLVKTGNVTLQEHVPKAAKNRKDTFMVNIVDTQITGRGKTDKFVFSEGGKPTKVVQYKMTDLSDALHKNLIGNIYDDYAAAFGVLPLASPELQCIATPAYIFSKKHYALGIHVENYLLPSINYLVQGEKVWTIFPPSKRTELVAHLNEIHEQCIGDSLCNHVSFHKNIYVGLDVQEKFEAVSFVQKPGQVVYLPSGVPHQVFASKDSVSISFNYIDMNYANKNINDILNCCQCGNIGDDNKEVLSELALKRLQESAHAFPVYTKQMEHAKNKLDGATLQTVLQNNSMTATPKN